MPQRPDPIPTNPSNYFGHNTMAVRIPNIVTEILHLNPDYSSSIQDNLKRLRENVANNGEIPMLELPAPDYEMWADAYSNYQGQTWQDTEWFFAETFFYRHVIQAVRYWDTLRDPFTPKKEEELEGSALWELVEQAIIPQTDKQSHLATLVQFALWSNRIDLSYALSQEKGSEATEEDLLVNDAEKIATHIVNNQGGTIHIIADNTGTELAMDLVLIDALLRYGFPIMLHVKMHPTFVSDATVADVWTLLSHCQSKSTAIQAVAERLQTAVESGLFRIAPDFYWNSSLFLWDMPDSIRRLLGKGILTISKGDANYRRIVGDAEWNPTTPYSSVVDYFPNTLATLRTLKSPPIVGLADGIAENLDRIDNTWRWNGQRGVIQANLD